MLQTANFLKVEYCKPRFTQLVEDLNSRGWTCDYADESGESEDQLATGAAQAE